MKVLVLLAFIGALAVITTASKCFLTIDSCNANCSNGTCDDYYLCSATAAVFDTKADCQANCTSLCVQGYCCDTNTTVEAQGKEFKQFRLDEWVKQLEEAGL